MKINFERNWDKSIGLGIKIYTHKHLESYPWHFHILFVLFMHFLEISIGREYDKENE